MEPKTKIALLTLLNVCQDAYSHQSPSTEVGNYLIMNSVKYEIKPELVKELITYWSEAKLDLVMSLL